jgi:HEAT repeats
MPENPVQLNEPAEAQEIPKEELLSATEVIQSMVKTSKGFRMYLPNNPLLARFVEELMGKLEGHFGSYGEYRLDTDQFELKYRGKVVYDNRDPKESMAFKMYSDGIRSLIFNSGIEEREICDVLDIIGKDRPGDADDDIVTLLWEKDLPNVNYILAEDFLEYDADSGGPAGHSSQKEKIKGIYQNETTTDTTAPPLIIPQHILTLADDETDWLKKAREADEKRNPLQEVTYILSTILVAEKDVEVFGDFADIMVKLTGNLIHSGEIKYALSLIKFLQGLATNERLAPENRNRLGQAIAGAFIDDLVRDLVAYVDEPDRINVDEFRELLNFFGKTAVRQMCELLGQIQKMAMRKVILEKLVEFGKASPQVLFPFLEDRRWYLVRNIVFVLAKIGDPATLEPVSRLISHKELRIRKEVLAYLEALPDPRAKAFIVKFLNDEHGAIRVRAMQMLSTARFVPALKQICALATAKDFEERDIAEKRAVFEAMGELGADQMVPMFREMLLKKFWFNKAKEKESVFLAVAGLRKIRTEAALAALEEASDGKSDEAKIMITQAIKALTVERTNNAARPEGE